MSTQNIELKAWKMLAELRGRMIATLQHNARNAVEYCADKPEDLLKYHEKLANPAKWDYYGTLSAENKKLMEALEFLLDDNMQEVQVYREWAPIK